ncbi:preprotein translocase subunit SecE [Candidatus Saccharibacteria bacterium]|nr:preprotein translocase subunit SecE [Candidatus Saccharibacteria bacterium]
MAVHKPRVRKTETVRQRSEKATAKAEAKSVKTPRRHIRRVASAAIKPLRRPARIISWPFRLRPVRFITRILGLILWPKYFRNAYKEVRQVAWPSRRDTWKLTLAVLIFAVMFGTLAAGTDYVLDKVIRRIVFRS